MGAAGLIPAGAGRTGQTGPGCGERTAHPRWRGEDERAAEQLAPSEGSSPLARGGHVSRNDPDLAQRLIPAGAGRTHPPLRTIELRRAHPRWRGEDLTAGTTKAFEAGSSPLARGGRSPHGRRGRGGGLIPAGAGRTHGHLAPSKTYGAHPRWRGEDSADGRSHMKQGGSSPLARGGLDQRLGLQVLARLIPAGAGGTA